MRKVLLTRTETGPEGTFGRIATDNLFQAYTLELPWENNLKDKSCIPAGVYVMSLVDSPRHGRVYEVISSVPGGRTNIQIHPANWAHQLLGCIAIGRSEGVVADSKKGGAFRGILSSRDATLGFMADLTDSKGVGEKFQLTIVWAPGLSPEHGNG